jgi:hypothetical protein
MTDNSHGPPGGRPGAGEAELADQLSPPLPMPVNSDSKPSPLTFVNANRAGNNINNTNNNNTNNIIHSLSVSRSPSNGPSPRSSRDSSPAGRAFRQQSAGTAQGMRSRKDSHDASPSRPPSITGHTVPSAAAIQRALSATVNPQLQPTSVTETASKLPHRTNRASASASGDTTPSWPVSPRLKSPPPSGSRRDSLRSQRKPEITALPPSIIVRPSSSTENLSANEDVQGDSESQNAALSKAGGRGASGAPTLATVQETSNPVTPANGVALGVR